MSVGFVCNHQLPKLTDRVAFGASTHFGIELEEVVSCHKAANAAADVQSTEVAATIRLDSHEDTEPLVGIGCFVTCLAATAGSVG